MVVDFQKMESSWEFVRMLANLGLVHVKFADVPGVGKVPCRRLLSSEAVRSCLPLGGSIFQAVRWTESGRIESEFKPLHRALVDAKTGWETSASTK